MRVPTLHHAQATLQTLQKRESEQAKLQSQIATGLRVQSPSDDPVAAAQAELARSRLARLEQDQRAAQLAQGTLSSAEGALGQGVDLLHSAREALVAAGNGGYTADERAKLALQLRATRDQLLAVANTPDAAGGYVFGGQGTTTAPFAKTPVGYAANAGTQQVGEQGRFASTVDGRAAFLALPEGNGVFVTASDPGNTGWIGAGSVSDATQLTGHGYALTVGGAPGALTYTVIDTTAGTAVATNVAWPADGTLDIDGQRVQVGGPPVPGDRFTLAPAQHKDIFTTLDDAIALLEDRGATGGAYQERLQRAQVGVDRGLDAMLHARAVAGEQLRYVEDAMAGGAQQEFDASARLEVLQDLDMARGISSLQASQTAYEAALKSYVAIRQTSLFDLIS